MSKEASGKKEDLYQESDTNRIKEELRKFSNHFENSLKQESIDVKWEKTVRHIMDDCIPNKLTSSRYNLPWFSRSLRRLPKSKKRAYNKAKKSGKDTDWKKFRSLRKYMH